MPTDTVELSGSHQLAPQGMRVVGRVPEDQPITVSIYLKPRDAEAADGAVSLTRTALSTVHLGL